LRLSAKQKHVNKVSVFLVSVVVFQEVGGSSAASALPRQTGLPGEAPPAARRRQPRRRQDKRRHLRRETAALWRFACSTQRGKAPPLFNGGATSTLSGEASLSIKLARGARATCSRRLSSTARRLRSPTRWRDQRRDDAGEQSDAASERLQSLRRAKQ